MLLRRRLMMAQQSGKPDLLEGYRFDNTGGSYSVFIDWLDNNTIHIYHRNSSFSGPSGCGKGFIGCNSSSSSYVYCFPSTPMNTLEYGKTYKLTLTVIEVTTNTATTEDNGVMLFAIGRQNYYGTRAEVPYTDIKVGAKFEATNKHSNSYSCIAGAAFNFTKPGLKWDFKCKVEFEEVK